MMCNRCSPLICAAMLSMAGVAVAQQTTPATSRKPVEPRRAAPSRAVMPAVEIPFEKFVLGNGLTLIVHEDRKAPIVAVNVWYHVGSKNEKPGRTGFAHLFEHLMFNGTEHYNDDYFKPLEKAGATDLNGTTNVDRTNYFQNVPKSAIDLVLWLESDRMGHLLGAIDQGRLDEQRGVVQNEKRQGENQPYGVTRQLLSENTYPAGHPYSWTTIGSMEDLTAAKLDDVREWFRGYYGAANAVIAIAGDIDAATARQKVEQFFGHIPAGPPVAKQQQWVAKMEGTRRGHVADRVPQARLYKVWNVPEWGSLACDQLALVSSVLSSGKSSRLYKRLVYDDQIATDVVAFVWQKEIGSQFYIQATAKPGGDLRAVEKAIDEELARFRKSGPGVAELDRIKAEYQANFVRGIERIGGFGGKSDILATNEVYGGRPDYFKVTLDRVAKATPEELRRVADDWLSDGVYVLDVTPYPQYTTQTTTLDRKSLPQLEEPLTPKFPAIATATLTNGLKVFLAERPAVPLVNVRLLVDAGYAADQGRRLGTATLALNMLDEGTRTRSALEIGDELQRIGAQLSTGSTVDFSMVSLSAVKPNLDPSLTLLADVVLNPAFPQADFARLQKLQIAQIKREKVTPLSMGLRVVPALLYGKEHAYGIPLTGSGTEDSVAAIVRDDLVKFHQAWFKPNNAALVVVGSTTLDEIVPLLEKHFGSWAKGDAPRKNVSDVALKTTSEVYLIDRPGSQQSTCSPGIWRRPSATQTRSRSRRSTVCWAAASPRAST
jgi:zinc protease